MAKKQKKPHKAPAVPASLLPPPPLAAAPSLISSPAVLKPNTLAASSSPVIVSGGFTGASGGLFEQHGTGNATGSVRSTRSASNASNPSLNSFAAPFSSTGITRTSPDSRPSTPTSTSSALGHLRAHLLSDEASRTAQSQHHKEPSTDSRKLRKRKPDAGSESSGTAEGGTERAASVYSTETGEERIDEQEEIEVPRELAMNVAIAVVEVLPPSPSPVPELSPSLSPSAPLSSIETQTTSSENTLVHTPPAHSNGPLFFLLAGPRYGLSLAESTTFLALRATKSAILLPFSLAHRLPIIGSRIPSPFSPPPSTSTPSPSPDSFKSPGFGETHEEKRQGIVWDVVELSLGVGLVSLWAAGVGALMVWNTVGGKTGEKETLKA